MRAGILYIHMMRKILGYRNALSGLLVCTMITASAATIPTSTFAQSIGYNYGTNNSQAGGTLDSLVQDTTGAIAAATIACNKRKIQSAVESLFSSDDEDDTGGSLLSAAISGASGAANGGTEGGQSEDQLVHLSATGSTNKALNTIARSAAAQADKETCTNAVERAAAGVILRQLTLSTINWINHGFNGNPLYATDTGSLLKSVGDSAVRKLNSIIGFDSVNYPFGKIVAQGLTNQLSSSFAQRAQYSLDQVVGQQYPGKTGTDFGNDFSIGGWNAFLGQTFLNNNPIGFNIAAQNELSRNLADTNYSPAQAIRDSLQRSGGFLDIRTCVDPNYEPGTDIKATEAANSAAADRAAATKAAVAKATNDLAQANASGDPVAIQAAQARLGAYNNLMMQANSALAAADAASAKAASKTVCAKWQTQTPGSIVAHQLTSSLDTTNSQLINGQDLSTDITAIFDALSNQLINKGLSSLSSAQNANTTDFTKNSSGGNDNTQALANVDTGPNGTWANQGSNFNVFTDIPSVIRYEDNSRDDTKLVTGCEIASGFSPSGQFCSGDPTLPEGYQQILEKEIAAQQDLVTAIYELDYCVPGPHPGAIEAIESTAQTFISTPTLFPASASINDFHKVLSTYGTTAGTIVGAVVAGAIAGSVVPGIGNAIGAVVGLVVGIVLKMIGDNHDNINENAYGQFVGAVMGVDFHYNGYGQADFNGYNNSSHVITYLAHRYKEAMQMTYGATYSDTVAADDAAKKDPGGRSTTQGSPNSGTPSFIPDLSTTNATRAKIVNASYNAFVKDISDLVALDNNEFPKVQGIRNSAVQNQNLRNASVSIESQLEHLMLSIQGLTQLQGYPGLTGALDVIPTITIAGNKIVTVNEGDSYTDAGATAVDRTGVDISASITSVNNVDTYTPGVYTITYDVTDKNGVSANQVLRTVRVLDPNGIVVNKSVSNYAVKTNIGNALYSGMLTDGTGGNTPVRDYNKDLQTIQNITDVSSLSEYEQQLRKINDTFQQLAPYIHGVEDLRKEEAVLSAMLNEKNSIAGMDANGTLLKNTSLAQCIKATTDPKSPYLRDGGPTARVLFSFVTANGATTANLPTWLTDLIPPQMSFLPDWHYAQGNGVQLRGKNWFPKDGEPEYPADKKDCSFLFNNFHGNTMTGTAGMDTASAFACSSGNNSGTATLDNEKLIRNDDISSLDLQPIDNALKGLEHIVRMY